MTSTEGNVNHMAAVVTMRQLLDAGVHFGHQTRRWNPKMKRFIHGDHNGIYIIDLRQTMAGIEKAYSFVRDLVADGGEILFIGTKRQAQDSVADFAGRCGMPYVNQRWLGGMLTNFETISKRVGKMKEYQRMRDSGEFDLMPKKEALLLTRELTKLERNLGGMRNLERAPGAVFILDTKKEDIAVTEANKLGIPIVAVVDTNCDPDIVQYVIPGNDDAIRSGELMARIVCDAVQEGRQIRARRTGTPDVMPRTPEEEAAKAREQADARRQATEDAAAREARVAAAKAEPAAEAAAADDVAAEAVAEAVVAEEMATVAVAEAAAAEEIAVEAVADAVIAEEVAAEAVTEDASETPSE